MPLDDQLDLGDVQSQHDHVPADRGAHDGGVRAVPRGWKLQRDAANGLLQLPHRAMAEHHDAGGVGAESHHFGISDDVRVMPHDDVLAGRGV